MSLGSTESVADYPALISLHGVPVTPDSYNDEGMPDGVTPAEVKLPWEEAFGDVSRVEDQADKVSADGR